MHINISIQPERTTGVLIINKPGRLRPSVSLHHDIDCAGSCYAAVRLLNSQYGWGRAEHLLDKKEPSANEAHAEDNDDTQNNDIVLPLAKSGGFAAAGFAAAVGIAITVGGFVFVAVLAFAGLDRGGSSRRCCGTRASTKQRVRGHYVSLVGVKQNTHFLHAPEW